MVGSFNKRHSMFLVWFIMTDFQFSFKTYLKTYRGKAHSILTYLNLDFLAKSICIYFLIGVMQSHWPHYQNYFIYKLIVGDNKWTMSASCGSGTSDKVQTGNKTSLLFKLPAKTLIRISVYMISSTLMLNFSITYYYHINKTIYFWSTGSSPN